MSVLCIYRLKCCTITITITIIINIGRDMMDSESE